MDNIHGRTIVITGAARGIGLAIAKALLSRGARVVIGDRDVDALGTAVKVLSAHGPASGYPLDVTDKDSFAAFLDMARSDGGGRIDVLVNNAGVMPIGPLVEQSDQVIRSAIEVNVWGVLNGCRLVLPEMLGQRRGHIVNIASLAGVLGVPGQVVYAGTKFAVVGMTAALADECAGHGVEVTAVLPTFTNTELLAGTSPTPAQRPIQPEDVAAAVAKVLDKPTPIVSVPNLARFFAVPMQLLPTRVRRSLNKKIGNDTTFLQFDAAARRGYEERAQWSVGVTKASNSNPR